MATLTSGTVALTTSAANRIEISWLSSNAGATPKLQISVNGATFTSGARGRRPDHLEQRPDGRLLDRVGQVRRGGADRWRHTSVTGRLYLDTFTSMRRTVITP